MNMLNNHAHSAGCGCGHDHSHKSHKHEQKKTVHSHDHLRKGIDCGCGKERKVSTKKLSVVHRGESCSCGHDHGHDHSHGHTHDGSGLDPDGDGEPHGGEACAIEAGCGCESVPVHADSCGCGHDHADSCGFGHDHADSCGCGHDHADTDLKSIPFIAGVIGFVLGEGIHLIGHGIPYQDYVVLGLCLVAYLLVGYKVLLTAGKNILKGQVFDENFLMSIASIGAFFIGEYPEGVAVMLFYQVGEYFQGKAVAKSRKSISELMDIRPDTANLIIDGQISSVPAESVRAGSLIAVRPGEKVPLDGVVKEGASNMDTKALTGESIPRDVQPGSGVLSGFVNGNGLLTVEVTKEFGQSTVSKILQMVENSSEKKSRTENFITKFARYYTPAVVIIAVALAIIPPFFLSSDEDWLYRALVFLVVSCPCALVISIPLGFFGGIGASSKRGILVKGSNYLEALNNVDTVVFDKTGTLTDGVFRVQNVIPSEGFDEETVLQYAAAAERHSSHPIAVSIREACLEREISEKESPEELEERPGYGVLCRIEGKEVLAGNARLLEEKGLKPIAIDEPGTIVYVAVEGVCAGGILIADRIKEDSGSAIAALKQSGVETVMLTGDRKEIGDKIGDTLGIDRVLSELLPHQKVEALEALESDKKKRAKKGNTIYVGDGINDAPVLARADIGIAMGGAGSDAAIEAADAVIMDDRPSSVVTARRIAGKTRVIVWQNIVFALGVKAVVLLLGALGFATMWEAIFADVGVAILAVLNATRAGK